MGIDCMKTIELIPEMLTILFMTLVQKFTCLFQHQMVFRDIRVLGRIPPLSDS